MKRRITLFVCIAAIAGAVAAGATALAAPTVKLPKCAQVKCRELGCPADVLCVSGSNVKSCADICHQ